MSEQVTQALLGHAKLTPLILIPAVQLLASQSTDDLLEVILSSNMTRRPCKQVPLLLCGRITRSCVAGGLDCRQRRGPGLPGNPSRACASGQHTHLRQLWPRLPPP